MSVVDIEGRKIKEREEDKRGWRGERVANGNSSQNFGIKAI